MSPAEPVWTAPAWPLWRRIAFRFLCVYFLLYGLGENGLIGVIPRIPEAYFNAWRQLVPWVAVHVFNLSGPVTVYPPSNGSGDTTLDYVQHFCFLAISAIAALVWSMLDRRRGEYRTLHAWLRILVRYALAITLFGYGFAKVFPLQFQPPNFARLLEPLHSFSPMGLLWTFMGFSPAYTIFAGSLEVLGGLLLLFRRTATLGALVASAVLANIVAMNFCYDVPAKLYSSNLLFMAIFLAAPDLGRLTRVLVLNQPAKPSQTDSILFRARPVRIASIAVKSVFIALIVLPQIHGNYNLWKSVHNRPQPPLYGVWQVEKFVRNGREIPPLPTDSTCWRRVIVEGWPSVLVEMTDDSRDSLNSRYDPTTNTVIFNASGQGGPNEFHYTSQTDRVTLSGRLFADSLVVEMRRIDPGFLLTHRGFHWISERPFNR